MASKSIDWDEVLVTKKPQQTEIEVSFKKADGDGFLGFGDEPGTPSGTTEDEFGCKNRIGLVSDDVWPLQNNQPHWVWITLNSIPTEEYTVTLTFTDGTLLRASGHYNYTTQDVLISPGSWEANEEGVTGIKWPLILGNVQDLLDVGTDTGNYNVAITAVDGVAVECWDGAQVSLDFAPTAVENPPVDTETGGETVPPTLTPQDCLPGNDCSARFDRVEASGTSYDSMLLIREGYAEASDLYQFYSGDTATVVDTSRESNVFILENADRSQVLFDGRLLSEMPAMDATRSNLKLTTEDVKDYLTQPASVLNTGTGNFTDNINYLTYIYPNHEFSGCDNYKFAAPENEGNSWGYMSERRYSLLGSIWDFTYEVPDPLNVPSEAIAVNSSNTFFEQECTQWISVFTGISFDFVSGAWRPNVNAADLLMQFPEYTHTHNGTFGNSFMVDGERGQCDLKIRTNGFQFTGPTGAGGGGTFTSPLKFGDTNRQGFAWFTCKMETYLAQQWDADNSSGDYGIYTRGCKYFKQLYTTWYMNGDQITPRSLESNFARPAGYDTSTTYENQKTSFDFAAVNKYMRNGDPLTVFSAVEADYLTHPIAFSSKYDPNFNPAVGNTANLTFRCNQGYFNRILPVVSGDSVPVLAIVDHSEAGRGFFGSDQFRAMINTFDNNNPDYCNRIP
jgi:hypothetical protein